MTLEYRAGSKPDVASDGNSLSGRATPFNTWTQIGDPSWGFQERVAPGAFKKSINDGNMVLLDQHDWAKPLARQSAGTLNVREKKDGAHFDAQIANTSYGKDAIENARSGNYGGMSFGFNVIRDEWTDDTGNPSDSQRGTKRTIHEAKVMEISTVTLPAYGGTSVSARDAVSAAREARNTAPIPKTAPYGDVAYADPKNKKYPVDTKSHAQAAWAYINKAANAAVYPLNGVSLSSVKAKIKAACAKFGITISSDQNSLKFDLDELREVDTDWLDLLDNTATLDGDPYADDFYERATRDDPDGHEYECIDHAVQLLSGTDPNVKGALALLKANQKVRPSEDAPEQKSGEPSRDTRALDDDLALRYKFAAATVAAVDATSNEGVSA